MTQSIANTIAACHGVKKESLYKLADFMPSDWIGRKRSSKVNKQSIQDFQKFAQRFAK